MTGLFDLPAAPAAESSPLAGVEILRGLSYRDGLAIDLYRPVDARGPLPVVVYLHGGGWKVGTRSDREDHRQIPLAALGFAVASVSYRLSGEAAFPAQLDDAREAVRWLRRNAARLGLDAARIAATGASAGGHLAALLGLTQAPSDPDLAAVDAVVAWFPVTELAAWDIEWRDAPYPAAGTFAWQGANRRGWPPPARAAALFGVDRIEDAPPEAVRAADPRSHIAAAAERGRVPPFLVLHGDADTAVDAQHGRWLHDALRHAGLASTFLVLADADHEDAAFGAPAPLGAVANFLRASLAQDGA